MRKSAQIKQKTEPNSVIKCIFGMHGEYFPEYGGLQNVFCRGIFYHFYLTHKVIKNDTIQKYIKGTSPFPRRLIASYLSTDGQALIFDGTLRLVNACMCMERLRAIQANLHCCIMDCNTIDENIIKMIDAHYVAVNANRLQIATYLSCVLSYLLPLL